MTVSSPVPTGAPLGALQVAIDEVGVADRVDRLTKRSIKKASKLEALRMVLSMIDLTTLEGADTPGKVRQLCAKARRLHEDPALDLELPHVAAVCVYPSMVAEAKRGVEGTSIKVASVATAFPSGQAPLAVKLADTRAAVGDGADEIDMVISRGRFLAGDYRHVFDEIAAVKEACGRAHLKVILETGELGPLDEVRRGARQVPLPHRARSPGEAPASSPSSRRWTAASRSRSRATSTCRSRPRTSSTTPAGPTSSSTPSRAGPARRSASRARSSRGTSRCSWPRGSSRPRWPAATPWCSSPPRPRRSPR
jgi:deoxyribose-phosphate aldolase